MLIALGWGAGNTAAKTTGAGSGQGVGRGLTAGAIAGTVVLIGSVAAFFLLQVIPGFGDAFTQAMQEAAQQNPDAGTALGLGIIGFGCGIVNFILMLIGGAIGGLMWKGTPAAAAYTPAGGSYVPNQTYSSTDQPYGGTPTQDYRDPGEPGGARVYDPNDPNRPQ